jgi:plasmid stabilization system protein ParE
MPFRVKVSAQAERDLDRIYRYIAAESSPQASVWFNGLQAALGSLSDMPSATPENLVKTFELPQKSQTQQNKSLQRQNIVKKVGILVSLSPVK